MICQHPRCDARATVVVNVDGLPSAPINGELWCCEAHALEFVDEGDFLSEEVST